MTPYSNNYILILHTPSIHGVRYMLFKKEKNTPYVNYILRTNYVNYVLDNIYFKYMVRIYCA